MSGDGRVIRRDKIAARAAGHLNPIVIVGDSHVERMETAFGYDQIDGSDVLWAGIAGARASDLVTYIPWAAIAATKPRKLLFMFGTNDALAGLYLDSNLDMTLAGAQNVLNAVSYAYGAVGGDKTKLVLMSDPPISEDRNINPQATFTYARMMYYAAMLPWTTFRWSSAPGPFAFVDHHKNRSISGCPASSEWNATAPCWSASDATLDGVHMTRPGYEAMLADVVAAL